MTRVDGRGTISAAAAALATVAEGLLFDAFLILVALSPLLVLGGLLLFAFAVREMGKGRGSALSGWRVLAWLVGYVVASAIGILPASILLVAPLGALPGGPGQTGALFLLALGGGVGWSALGVGALFYLAARRGWIGSGESRP